MFGGGRCNFRPNTQSDSCREDRIDLFSFAEDSGYYVAQNRSQFDDLSLARVRSAFPSLISSTMAT